MAVIAIAVIGIVVIEILAIEIVIEIVQLWELAILNNNSPSKAF